ncbi:pyridoxal phosphate-dependent aminotransferase [Ruminococcus flavefaciens]|uniref:L-threonine O-3-phosphate decarboxylase n=1 Tax=Ruminococcus flavefaciens TaxID=1265 RepID=A0A1K1NLP2_RUMFL|nr:threonine-phosphate decarboxylase [Ruminococcus flavefaciens]SFW35350.1 L-threonine O-3-phosphate decarboxylase [Ruminococcus flavefaciens]
MIQQHGGNIGQLSNILDFSANINPLGSPESVKKAVAETVCDIEKYPDPYCTELRDRLGEHERISAENIVCGNGADDLIFRIVYAFRPERALICVPTFSEYSRALSETGCEIQEHILDEELDFELGESILTNLDRSLDMCFICTPNNPTGRLIAPEILAKISVKCLENNIILVCDECFMGFVEDSENYSLRQFLNEKCIILKAFTKLFAMAGIRLGYAVCGSSRIAERIQQSGQFWSVSALAQTAGIAALDETEYVNKTVRYITEERRFLAAELAKIGVKVYDGAANFLMFLSRIELAEELLAEGILIRDCANFSGLTEGFYRVAVRTHDENIRLINAVRRCLNG